MPIVLGVDDEDLTRRGFGALNLDRIQWVRAARSDQASIDRAVKETVAVLDNEIDKAHPDVPNGLLVALGSNQITVPYLASPITIDANRKRVDPLRIPKAVAVSPIQIVITTNEERELPAAFVRRCVTYALDHPSPEDLVEIARAQFNRPKEPFKTADVKLALAIARRLETGAVPPALRDIDVHSGCAADYDGWLTEARA